MLLKLQRNRQLFYFGQHSPAHSAPLETVDKVSGAWNLTKNGLDFLPPVSGDAPFGRAGSCLLVLSSHPS